MRHAFVDESGDLNPKSSGGFLVVAAITAGHQATRAVERDVRWLRERLSQSMGREMQSEIKAVTTAPEFRAELLQRLASRDIGIVAVALHKNWPRRDDAEARYREAVAETVLKAASTWPQMRVTIDKRYTDAGRRALLDNAIKVALMDLPSHDVIWDQLESHKSRGVQAADFVAWSLHRKWGFGDTEEYEIIRGRIVCESILDVGALARPNASRPSGGGARKKHVHPGA